MIVVMFYTLVKLKIFLFFNNEDKNMKNKNLFLKVFLGSCICFVVFVLIFLLFQKWNLFDFNSRSLQSVIIEGVIVSVIFFVFMFLYSKNHLKKRQMDKTK